MLYKTPNMHLHLLFLLSEYPFLIHLRLFVNSRFWRDLEQTNKFKKTSL